MKSKVILFGAGKLFAERKDLIEEKDDLICILDNNAKEMNNTEARVCLPEELIDMPDAPVVIMSDYFVQMVLQVSKIIGEKECNKRVRIGRICYPVLDEEKILKNESLQIAVESGKVYCILDNGQRILLNEGNCYIKKIYCAVSRKRDILLEKLLSIEPSPIDAYFGRKRGEPVDRYYIEKFLDEYKRLICGRCLEIAEDTYTKQFGEERVTDS